MGMGTHIHTQPCRRCVLALMESASARAEVIVALRTRVNTHVAARLSEREALQLAMAAAMRDPDEVFGFLLPGHLAKIAIKRLDDVMMTANEWKVLFGIGTQPVRDGGVATIVNSSEFSPQTDLLSIALRQTISEKDSAAVFARQWPKLLCFLAMHLEMADQALVSVLGTVISADKRRIEELQNSIDDDGVQIVLISKIIIALSESLV